MGNIKESRLRFTRRVFFALSATLVAFLASSVVLQVLVLPAAVNRAVLLFPEVRPLADQAIIWGACAVFCWQVIAVIGLLRVRRGLKDREGSSTHGWIGGMIGCLLVFAALDLVAFIELSEAGYTPPVVMLGLVTGGLMALISAAGLALLLGSRPSIGVSH